MLGFVRMGKAVLNCCSLLSCCVAWGWGSPLSLGRGVSGTGRGLPDPVRPIPWSAWPQLSEEWGEGRTRDSAGLEMPHVGLKVPRDTSNIRNYSCPCRAPLCPGLCQGCAGEHGMPTYGTKTAAMCHPRYSLKEEQQVWRVPAEIGCQVLGSEQPGQAGQLGRERMVTTMPGCNAPAPPGSPWPAGLCGVCSPDSCPPGHCSALPFCFAGPG